MAASLVAAVLLLATPQARGWALEDHEVMPDDMVLVEKPAEQVVVEIPGGASTITPGSIICLQCRCCSRSNPGKCLITTCCSSLNCDRGGKCNNVQDKCGCAGCDVAN
ncbi:unnamed protein product [Miscanthus lutarioriparius]|uniref:Uncharacterized protein n=1 Tax=Miscanthus lutarioriparius TaxID=422564 RepID=A0A811NDY9_9POAL|nr:unnamed protein product [Miscanthus lutarioriparius]